MGSSLEFVEYIVDQIGNSVMVTYRKMFGEYALYCDKKIFALICDDRLFIKPTVAGRKYIGNVTEAPPYPGAKNSYLIEERIDDREWLSELVRITVSALPEPRPKKKR